MYAFDIVLAPESLDQALGALLDIPVSRRLQFARNCERFRRDDLAGSLLDRGFESRFSDPTISLHFAELGKAVAEGLDSGDLKVRAATDYANALKILGRLREAEAAFLAAEAQGRMASAPIRAHLLECFASLKLRQGDAVRSWELSRDAVALRETLGDSRALAQGIAQSALAAHEMGDSRRALELQVEANLLIDHADDPRLSLAFRHNGIRYILGMGRSQEAWNLLEASEDAYRRAGDPLILLRRLYLRAKIAREFGTQTMDAIAEADFRSAAEEATERGLPYEAAKILLDFAGLLASRGRFALLPGLVEKILPLFDAMGIERESLVSRSLLACAANNARASILLRRTIALLQKTA